jgi:hypothetical protein
LEQVVEEGRETIPQAVVAVEAVENWRLLVVPPLKFGQSLLAQVGQQV